MLTILYILTALSLLAVVFTVIMGTGAMGMKSDGAREKSNKWMWRRVGAQICALCLIFLTVWVRNNSGA